MFDELKIIFMGTPEFSAQCLLRLLENNHTPMATYCQPPRKKGRGLALQKCPVQKLSEKFNIECNYPIDFKNSIDREKFHSYGADLVIVVAYGLYLPKVIYTSAKINTINLHTSLLPRWRGAAPIQRAIMAGDKQTAAQIMQVGKGLDTGVIYDSFQCSINDDDDFQTLHDKLLFGGAKLLCSFIDRVKKGCHHKGQVQSEKGICYAHKITREDRIIDFYTDPQITQRQIRALSPQPSALANLVINGKKTSLKIIKVRINKIINKSDLTCPFIVNDKKHFIIQYDDNQLEILFLQKEGKRAQAIAEFLNGHDIEKIRLSKR